jgi:hypothetical integral membrane protein (TIGR02206 family)
MLAVFVAGILPLVRFARTHRGDETAGKFARVLALLLPAFTVPFQVLDFATSFDLDTTLPFNLCDLAWPAAALALWTRRPYFVGLTYYWGLTLTIQSIITPSLDHPFPDPRFFGYWGMHMLIVWSALYLVWGLGLSPRWREYGTTILTTLSWMVLVSVFNAAADTNYGYLRGKPGSASILDYLGPWPWYVAAEVALAAGAWALITWPWNRTAATRAEATPAR